MRQIVFSRDGQDILSGVELRNGQANPFGWSTYEVWHVGDEVFPGAKDEQHIADLYCGEPTNLADGITFRLEEASPSSEPALPDSRGA